jgi:hypothetical protein
MRFDLKGLLLAAVLAAPIAAQATLVHWNVQGTLAQVDQPQGQPPFPSEVDVGNPFSVLLGFDTNPVLLAVSTDPGGGKRYRYATSSITLDVSFGALGPFHFQDTGAGGNFLVRDNFPDPTLGDLVDGITFGLVQIDGNTETVINLLFRGPVLDLLDIPNLGIPGTPDPRLSSLRLARMQIARCDIFAPDCTLGFIDGAVESVAAVPEPGTWALAGLALAALGATRRRARKA